MQLYVLKLYLTFDAIMKMRHFNMKTRPPQNWSVFENEVSLLNTPTCFGFYIFVSIESDSP